VTPKIKDKKQADPSLNHSQPPARLLPLRNLQPFATPDALHPVLANLPALPLQQRRDSTIAVTSILRGKIGDGPGECIFVLALCQLLALRAAIFARVACQSRRAFGDGTGQGKGLTGTQGSG
jgi:hypothetical protein